MDKKEAFVSRITEEYGVNCGICDVDKKIFHSELRGACEVNTCGNFGKCYTCPPFVGEAGECIEKASSYKTVIVYQKIYPLEDSYDFYGMVEAGKEFHSVIQEVSALAKETFGSSLVLGAGGCRLCESCAAKTGEPCRHPDKTVASLESYCIQVSELAVLAGMKYINGQNTVTYFGGIFLGEEE